MIPTDLKSLKSFAEKVKKDNAMLLNALTATYGHRVIAVETRHGMRAKFERDSDGLQTLTIQDNRHAYLFWGVGSGVSWDHHGTDILAVLKRADWTEDQITEIIEREEE